MALTSALEFIERVRQDAAFRKAAYAAALEHSFPDWLAKSEYRFTMPEIWDAFRSMLLKCKDEEAAEEVKELRCWFSLLAEETEEEKTSSSCGGCAQRGSCNGNCE
mgnify:CR=1 FL=1